MLKSILTVIVVFILFLFAIYVNHRIRLNKEAKLRASLGKTIIVDGHDMNIYVEGSGDTTLVFMSGGGTCSPVLDFRSLYSLLSDDYQIVVHICGIAGCSLPGEVKAYFLNFHIGQFSIFKFHNNIKEQQRSLIRN